MSSACGPTSHMPPARVQGQGVEGPEGQAFSHSVSLAAPAFAAPGSPPRRVGLHDADCRRRPALAAGPPGLAPSPPVPRRCPGLPFASRRGAPVSVVTVRQPSFAMSRQARPGCRGRHSESPTGSAFLATTGRAAVRSSTLSRTTLTVVFQIPVSRPAAARGGRRNSLSIVSWPYLPWCAVSFAARATLIASPAEPEPPSSATTLAGPSQMVRTSQRRPHGA